MMCLDKSSFEPRRREERQGFSVVAKKPNVDKIILRELRPFVVGFSKQSANYTCEEQGRQAANLYTIFTLALYNHHA
jgi:hypothetical protein